MLNFKSDRASPPADASNEALVAIDARPSFERHRVRWAFLSGAVAASLVGGLAHSCAKPSERFGGFGAASLQHRPIEPIGGDEILRDIASAHARASAAGWFPASNDAGRRASQRATAPAIAKAPPRLAAVARAPVAAEVVTPSQAAYADLFGAPEQYQAGNALRAVTGGGADVDDEANGGEGTLMPARLVTEVASVPTGGPVVATLQRPVRIAGQLLPRGAEVHGVCKGSGNSDTRVFVHFDFVRLSGGRSLPIRGEAVDLQGRNGIPGRKMVTGKSVGSVGLSAATRVARALGRSVAGTVGNVVGSGLEGAADAGQQKAERFDQDEYVVVAGRGAPIQIYVTQMKRGAKPTQ